MSVEVVMPQMGESITEGTISKWLKEVGDKIERDEPILEISTDKVDAEVPAPAAGVLLEIRHNEGETVEVGTALAIIGEAGESAANGSQQSAVSSQQSAAISQPEPAKAVEPAIEKTESEPVAQQPQTATASDNGQSQAATAAAPSTAPATTSADATEVVMPQMGESITEGTISKWLKGVGETIERDEPLLEISTDKVDAEVPSPAAGKLLEIRHQEGETVEVGTVLALVGSQNGAASAASPSASTAQKQAETATAQATGADAATAQQAKAEAQSPQTADRQPAQNVEETAGRSYDYDRPQAVNDAITAGEQTSSAASAGNGQTSVEELRRTKSSPLVRNIAKEHGIDLSRIPGSGMSGRVTKKDILSFIESGAALKPQDLLRKDAPVAPQITPQIAPATIAQPQTAQPQRASYSAPQVAASVGDRVEPMSVMRRKIAEHMTFSKQTSAHVTSVYEIDMTSVARFRERNKAEFQSRYGTKLTFMPFIFQATTAALRKFPVVNAQVAGDQIIYKGDINLGMAVALDWGLIVPVIKRAEALSLSGLALAANDLADRARTKKLMPDEVAGGTFTITNPGVFGGLFGTPIINQPQVAILCVGTIEKRPKVITTAEGDDVIAIRSMAYFALTYDHRIVDGADAEKFLSFMKEYLETTQFSL
ncbi:MAG TPA: 2-oxoglutarate dehydrogenase, E2 component, dihydrolipoamide succinyltransferase [Pyrinomonadaceae bacterium]|nr:2-oxoglutarate dehydrogenase, E2 component, dihydrolipoamide succinyltransferase [Pyrinomonadaceae bacterium]